MLKTALLGLSVAFASGCTGSVVPSRAAHPVTVERGRMTITFPPETVSSLPDSIDRARYFGFYDWRFGSESNRIMGSLYLEVDSARQIVSTASLQRLIDASRLRACQPPRGHALICARSLGGRGHAAGGRVTLVITDTAMLGAMLRDRPTRVWRAVFRPDRPFFIDTVTVRYR